MDKYDKKLYSSNYGSKDHISNLWKQTISGPDEKKLPPIIRSGSSRGNESATREYCLNVAIIEKSGKEKFDQFIAAEIEKNPSGSITISLNLSNIQLMTPGKLGDGDIPLKQMQKLSDFSERGSGDFYYTYKDGDEEKTVNINIKLEKPLLFNFVVNFQHFKLGPLASSKEIDEQNAKSFKQLFGANPSELAEGELCKEGSILDKSIKKHAGEKEKLAQIVKLATQIIDILKKHPRGIESNPYALPVRVILLTRLIDYATTYGCKSGKDRTGVCSLELEMLATKLLSGEELYDPETTTDKEREILKQLYLQGEANKIAGANTGQKGLKIQEVLGFTSLSDRFWC